MKKDKCKCRVVLPGGGTRKRYLCSWDLCSRGHNLSAEGSRVTSLRTPAREQGGAHARRPSCTHEYTPRRAVEGRHAHPAAAMLFEAARKCMRNKLRSVQLLYYVQHLGPVRGVVLTAHARPAWARAAHQNTCHTYSTRGHSACAIARVVELPRSAVLYIERAFARTSRPAAACAPSQTH